MSFDAWFTIGTIALVVGALMTNRINVDVCMVGGLTLLLLFDIIDVEPALAGFAHPALILIGSLFVVAGGLSNTGAMEVIAGKLLGRPASIAAAQLRLMVPVAIMSGFMNNTPIVAIYLPIVNDWARRLRVSASKLYMPLSYAAIMGGKLTYIGTASNIVLFGLFAKYLTDDAHDESTLQWFADVGATLPSDAMRFWGVGILGVPALIVGTLYIMATSRWLLPDRRSVDQAETDARQYEIEMLVQEDSLVVGKTIEDAGLRQLPGLFLVRIERDGKRITAVAPEEVIEAGDILVFVGVLESVVDLRKIRGLVPATDQVQKVEGAKQLRTLVEAVVARDAPFAGKTVRSSNFRGIYNAAIIAVLRHGQQIQARIGDIVLQPGDTLLLETQMGFIQAHRYSKAFYLVSAVEGSRPPRHDRAPIALAILVLLIGLFILGPVSGVAAALLCAMLMIGTRCITGTDARRSINWQVLVVIGCAMGMGRALEVSGGAESIAHGILTVFADVGPQGMLFVIFAIAALFAQLITNTGAAVLMFPITMATTRDLGVDPMPFVFILMVGAGANFISPVAYQTNLMVYGPGGYRFMDFVRVGTPMTILIGIVTTLIAGWLWL